MLDIYKVRRANLRKLIEQWGGPTSLATKLGHSNGSYLAQLAGPTPSREVSERVARSIEKSLNLEAGWLDMNHRAGPSRKDDELDPNLLTKVVSAVTEELRDEGAKLAAPKFAELVSVVYEISAQRGVVDAVLLRRLINLAK